MGLPKWLFLKLTAVSSGADYLITMISPVSFYLHKENWTEPPLTRPSQFLGSTLWMQFFLAIFIVHSLFNAKIFVFGYFMEKSTGILVSITKWAFQVPKYLNLRLY